MVKSVGALRLSESTAARQLRFSEVAQHEECRDSDLRHGVQSQHLVNTWQQTEQVRQMPEEILAPGPAASSATRPPLH